MRTEAVVANVAVLATQKRAGSRVKTSTDQSVDPIDRRHDFASKSSAATVAYPSPCDRVLPSGSSQAARRKHEKPLSEIAGIAGNPSGVHPRGETAGQRCGNSGNCANPRNPDEMGIGAASRYLAGNRANLRKPKDLFSRLPSTSRRKRAAVLVMIPVTLRENLS